MNLMINLMNELSREETYKQCWNDRSYNILLEFTYQILCPYNMPLCSKLVTYETKESDNGYGIIDSCPRANFL